MDNAWQSKCGFIWPSLTPSAVSSSLLRPPEPRNQMLNGGNPFYPHFVQGPNLSAQGSLHEPMFPCSSNLNFSSSDHADRGNSFLSLLSAPPSLMQCDMKQFSLPKPFIASSKFPNDNNNVVVSVPASGASPAWDSLFAENTHNVNLRVGQEFCRVSSPWKEMGANVGGSSLHDVVRTVNNMNYQRLEQVKADCYQNAPNKDKAKDFSSQRSSHPGGILPASVAKLISTNVLASQAVQLESSSSTSHPSFSVTSDCPRVFCSSTTGYLLLSNTGLLGVVCSCHGFHMSISKFSQHSGLCDVNPGDAIYVDNGETIAQWRKSYFCKFGIRIPEDHSGWDWPEGFSATTGLLKRCAVMSNVSNNSDLYGLIGYNGASSRSTQLWNIAARPENRHQDNFVDCTTPGHSKMSKLVDTRAPERPIPACINSLSGGGNPFVSFPDFRKFESDSKESEVNGFGPLKEGKIVDIEVGSSNIELRLGQPSPRGQVSGNSTLSAYGSHLVEIHGDPQKSIFAEQLIPNSALNSRNSREFQGCWQYLQSDQNIMKSSARREQGQSTFTDNVSKVDLYPQGEQFKGDAARGSVISMLLSPLKSPSEGKLLSKATNNVINGSHGMPRKCDTTFFPCNRDGENEKLFNCSQLAPHQHIGKGKEVGYATDALHVVINQHVDKGKEVGHSADFFRFSTSLEPPIQCGGNRSILNGVVGPSNDKSVHPCRFCGISADACNIRGCLKYPGKIHSHGFNLQADHALLRSAGSPTVSGHILPSAAVPQGPSALPLSVPTVSSVSSTKETDGTSTLVDENMRSLAFKHVLEFSNQDHTTSTVRAKNQECRLIDNSWIERMKRFHAGPLVSKGGQGPSVARKPDDSEFSVKSHQPGATFLMASNGERSASTAEVNNWCNFSRFLQGASLQSRDGEMQSGPSREPCQNELPSLRHAKIQGSVTTVEQANSCLKGFPAYLNGRCSSAVHTNCLHGECGSSSKTSFQKQDDGGVDGRGSVALDLKVLKEQSGSVCQNGSFEKTKQVEFHALQWRDVPGKVKGICDVNLGDQPSDLFGGKLNVRDRIDSAAVSCFNQPAQDAESLKEQEVSNISQASIEENNKDSCTVAVDDARCIKNSVVDEGSGIEKCWSSDDALDSARSAEFLGFSCKMHSMHRGSSKGFPNQASRSLIEELRLIDSLRLKKLRGSLQNESSIHEKSHSTQKCDDCFKSGKRKRATKAKTVNASSTVPGLHSADTESPKCKGGAERSCHSSTIWQKLLGPDQGRSRDCTHSVMPAFKRRRFASLSAGTTIHKRNMHRLYFHEEAENDQIELDVELHNLEKYEESGGKRFKLEHTAPTDNKASIHGKKAKVTRKPNSVDCVKNASKPIVHACKRKARPIVCGEYGAICSGDSLKPAKIVPLKKVLKAAAKTCSLVEKKESRSGTAKQLQEATNSGSYGCSDELYTCEEGKGKESESRIVGKYDYNSTEETETACFPRNKSWDGLPGTLEKEKCDASTKNLNFPGRQLKPKFKEVRKRSLYELTNRGNDSSCTDFSTVKISRCISQAKCGSNFSEEGTGDGDGSRLCFKSIEEHRQYPAVSDLDSFCCVCKSSNKDEINCLLECNRCLIRVHQACYGVPKVPKTHWYCRPCRTSSKNIVCVLCGYGGGAMTRALRSRNIVKSLLKARKFLAGSRPNDLVSSAEALENQLHIYSPLGSELGTNSFPIIRPTEIHSSPASVWKNDLQGQLDTVKIESYSPNDLMVQNSITAGALDSTVKQWVHMVCGLWTPATRCPNVDTMSAFDVSGASCPKGNVVCSICNQSGGSFIQCRVVDCFTRFHPWCAHQKGLLQSEVEGVDNENVGFYGRCELHAAYHQSSVYHIDTIDAKTGHSGEHELTCARTEGYRGRRREGFRHNLPSQSNDSGKCLVSQEQLDAWLHINGQKPFAKGPSKLQTSDIESDCRKEFARYKQSKGWKNLVVYKSGIHALGLYTSQFISRGAMVVEYVGEVVGLRVADKRESEYQSGRGLQYKSACYFFRVDKEHIIDATRRGGIARFVNHSCLPNCVAKVISIRNEKKVVFFAERDIYPGEEITYDYHFNHEDEGKKIPCFCNSKNCRRYLN